MAILSSFAVAGVFDDAHFLYYGGVDKNGNGYIDSGDIVDYRHYGDDSIASGKFAIYNSNAFTEKQHRFCIGNETVRLASAGVTLENEPCIRWRQVVYTNENDEVKAKTTFLQKADFPIPDSESFTIVMRFRPTMLGAKDSSVQLLSFANTWGSAGMLLYNKSNSSSTGGYIRYSMGKTGIDKDLTTLTTTNGVWHEVALILDGPNRKITCGCAHELSFDWRGPSYGMGYMRWDESTISQSTTGWSFKPETNSSGLSTNPVRILGGKGDATEMNFASHAAFYGDVHMIGLWPRVLSKKEIYEVLGNRRPAVFEVGDADASASTFFKGTAGQDVTIDALPREWHNIPATFANGATATIRFTVPESYASLPQVLRLKADSGSCAGTVSAMLDGSAVLGDATVRGGAVSRIGIDAGILTAGSHAIALRRTDGGSGDLSLSCISLGGSWQIGLEDGSRSDFNAPNNAIDFYLSDGNSHDFASEVKNAKVNVGTARDLVFHFDVPDESEGRYRYCFETKATYYNYNYPTLVYYSLNGGEAKELINIPAVNKGRIPISIAIPASSLLPGRENTLRIANAVDSGDVTTLSATVAFDYYRLISTEVKGLVLTFR